MLLLRLKDLRAARNLRQADMADLLQINRTTYVKYETGASEPPLETVARLADFFGVSVDYLLGRNSVNLPAEETELLKIFRQLNPTGRESVLGAAQGILQLPGMRQDAAIPSAM